MYKPNFFISPNIELSHNAEKQMNKSYLTTEEIYLTLNNWDHQTYLGDNSYYRRKIFYPNLVGIYCRWDESKKIWKVTTCFKRSQK